MQIRFTATLAILLALACHTAENTVIPEDLENLESIRPVVARLTDEEKKLFDKYMLLHTDKETNTPNFPPGITIAKAIAEQRRYDSDPRRTVVFSCPHYLESISPSVAKLTEEEKALFNTYILLHTVKKTGKSTIPEGITIEDAIEEQRTCNRGGAVGSGDPYIFTVAKTMSDVASVTLHDKRWYDGTMRYPGMAMYYSSGQYSVTSLSCTLACQNNSSKDIAYIKGSVQLLDQHNRSVMGFDLDQAVTIGAGQKVVILSKKFELRGATHTNITRPPVRFVTQEYYDPRLRALGSLPLDKAKVYWSPTYIRFSDGYTLKF